MSSEARELLEELIEVFREQDDDAIWTYEDIGKYLKLEPETARKIAKRETGFPRPVVARGRYRAGAVRAWAVKANRV